MRKQVLAQSFTALTLCGLLFAGCGGGDSNVTSQPTNGASAQSTQSQSTSSTNSLNCQLSLNPVLNGPNVTDFKTFWACQEFDPSTQTTSSYGLSVFADGSGILFDATGVNSLHTFLWTQKTCSEIVVENTYGTDKIIEISGAATSGIYNFKTASGFTDSCVLINLPAQTPKPSVGAAFTGNPTVSTPSEIPQGAFVMGYSMATNNHSIYLGKITSNGFDPDSICNEFGTYGSSFSSTSMFNELGVYGNTLSTTSVNNSSAKVPPVIVDSQLYDPATASGGNGSSIGAIGVITINSTKFPNHLTLSELTDYLGCTR